MLSIVIGVQGHVEVGVDDAGTKLVVMMNIMCPVFTDCKRNTSKE